jgi:hypothetical protein
MKKKFDFTNFIAKPRLNNDNVSQVLISTHSSEKEELVAILKKKHFLVTVTIFDLGQGSRIQFQYKNPSRWGSCQVIIQKA